MSLLRYALYGFLGMLALAVVWIAIYAVSSGVGIRIP